MSDTKIDQLCDAAMVDEVAKELFVRRVFNIKDMGDYEIENSARECYKKAKLFVKIRAYKE